MVMTTLQLIYINGLVLILMLNALKLRVTALTFLMFVSPKMINILLVLVVKIILSVSGKLLLMLD